MIRQIIVPQQRQHMIQFPDEMIGKPTEVIAFNITENALEEFAQPDAQKMSYEVFLALLRKTGFNANGWKFDREEANDYDE